MKCNAAVATTATIFITATDTNAGKTFVTKSLLQLLRQQQVNVLACKPIATGCNTDGINDDVQTLLQVQDGLAVTDINCWTFTQPSAPLFADKKKLLQAIELLKWCQIRSKIADLDLVLFEAIGGLFVPLTSAYMVADWLQDLPQTQVLLVVRAHLGGLNHTLLTLEKLHAMQRFPAWIVINDADNCGIQMLQQHVYCVRQAYSHTYPNCHIRLLPYGEILAREALLPLASTIIAYFNSTGKRKIS